MTAAPATGSPRPDRAYNGAPIAVIEFIGLPGAGKTTVAKALIKQLQGTEIHRTRSSQDFKGDRDFGLGKKILQLVRSRNGISFAMYVMMNAIYFRIFDKYPFRLVRSIISYHSHIARHLQHYEKECLIIDHGIVNFLWLMSVESGRRIIFINKILTLLRENKRNGYVYVRLDPIHAACRVRRRWTMETYFDFREQDINEGLFRAHADDFDHLASQLAAAGAPVLAIDGAASVDEKVKAIRRWMTQHGDPSAT